MAQPCLSFPSCSQEPNPLLPTIQPPGPTLHTQDHPISPLDGCGLGGGQDEHPSSGTFSQRDWHRPGCLSHGHRALQGEELHPKMGREVGPMSRGAAGSP